MFTDNWYRFNELFKTQLEYKVAKYYNTEDKEKNTIFYDYLFYAIEKFNQGWYSMFYN